MLVSQHVLTVIFQHAPWYHLIISSDIISSRSLHIPNHAAELTYMYGH